MRVKRYVVKSMPDALSMIRNDLGKDAVILDTKRVRTGGFLGLFSKKRIEVIAAIDLSKDQQKKPPASHYSSSTNVKSGMDSVTSTPVRSYSQEFASSSAAITAPERTDQAARNQPSPMDLAEEMRQMKQMMYRLVQQNRAQAPQQEWFGKIEKRLSDHEFDPLIIEEVLYQAIEQQGVPSDQLTEQEALQIVKDQLKSRIQSDQIQGISETTRMVHFVGPTGVGKTTTIAKLAAEQVLKHRKKVGFITSDTYRIAAIEQLKTYATILDVPLEVVYSPLDLNKALEKLSDRDLIFMDTAGRNFRNEMYVSELNSLLKKHNHSETYLVLSLTMKYKDMKVVTENFSRFHIDKVLFTKMDETESYGSIFNLIHHFPLKLSYIANGQNVPDDICKLNTDELVDKILEEDPDE